MFTLPDIIKDIEHEIAFCHEQIRYFDSLADLEGKKVMARIKDLKVARRRLIKIRTNQVGEVSNI